MGLRIRERSRDIRENNSGIRQGGTGGAVGTLMSALGQKRSAAPDQPNVRLAPKADFATHFKMEQLASIA